ncbi:MAG: hypothetical protein CBE00_03530 [Planctomycetaceae bacterium TMED240]|nr:hypothetical protein [Rhodopirellula sp.]OUX07734.1 MAG: hypothetical protein CBE00_03530 [Planctomycetaceae bacterium TMED240]
MFKRLLFALSITLLPTFALADEIVRYQLTEWKAKHIHDAKKADTIMQTLKKLGCELKKNQHNGHIDVKYRCVKWHELKLNSHADAHKWEKWLKEFNFKTEHKH